MLNQSLICEVLVSCDPGILSPSGTGTMMYHDEPVHPGSTHHVQWLFIRKKLCKIKLKNSLFVPGEHFLVLHSDLLGY